MSSIALRSLDDVLSATGKTGVSEWREISQKRVGDFADATDDHQWIHLDVERAKAGPFGATIAHGFLLLSLLPSFLEEIVEVSNFSMLVNYGLDKVRFPSPVPAGSLVRAEIEAVDVRTVNGGAQITWNFVVQAKDASKPSCVATSLANFYV